ASDGRVVVIDTGEGPTEHDDCMIYDGDLSKALYCAKGEAEDVLLQTASGCIRGRHHTLEQRKRDKQEDDHWRVAQRGKRWLPMVLGLDIGVALLWVRALL